jgi:CheY-like chemotaxis protein/predicted regulator of Ras-like GTPase activity (Roadblock/LC7/MglB family)
MNNQNQRKRVLIVDDEAHVAEILAEGLNKLSHKYLVETADGGNQALARLKEIPYDLIITDYRMPGMNGVQLAQLARQHSPHTQVILMTAYGTTGLQHVVGSMALNGYLDKPVSIEKIRQIVEQAVGYATEGEDPYRSGQRETPAAIYDLLQTLQGNTNAHCALLVSLGGHPIELAGQTNGLDIASISALVAANFMAAAELARLLGNTSVFKSSYHEGLDYDIYAHAVNGECLLAVIFDSESKAGIVRFYTNNTVPALASLLALPPAAEEINPALPQALVTELDRLFR